MVAGIFIVFFLMLILAVPIPMAMGFATIFPSFSDPSFPGNLVFIARSMIRGADSTPILAIPLFMLSGAIMAVGGLSQRIFDVFAFFIGKVRGGMPSCVVLTCLFYGAISGSGPATAAAVGAMCIPLLIKLGYDKVFSAAVVATAAGLGVIIPPSIPYIVFGLVTNTSVGALFTAGILPGILIAFFLILFVMVYCRIKGEDRVKLKDHYEELRQRGFIKVFKDGFWALLAPIIILGGIYGGIVTPTEAACVSVFYAMFICIFVYRTIKIKGLLEFFKQAVSSYAPLIMALALAQAFTRILVMLNAPQDMAVFLTRSFNSPVTFLLALNILLLLLGMVIDVGPANIIFAPILLPFAMSVGIDPVHLGIIMTVNLSIGFVTPPFGMNLFVAAPMVRSDAMILGRKALPLIGVIIIALMIITYVPGVSLLLGR